MNNSINKTVLLLCQNKDGTYHYKAQNKCTTYNYDTDTDPTTTTKRTTLANNIKCCNVMNTPMNDMAAGYIVHILPRMVHTALESIYNKQANPVVYQLIKENARRSKDDKETQNAFSQFLTKNDGKNIDIFLSQYWRYRSAIDTLENATQAYNNLLDSEVIDIDIDFLASTDEKQNTIEQVKNARNYCQVVASSQYSDYCNWWIATLAINDLDIVIDALFENLKAATGLKNRIAKEERFAEQEQAHIVKHHTYKIENGRRVEIIPYDTIEETAYGKLTVNVSSETMVDDIYQASFVELLTLYNSGYINHYSDVWYYRYAVYKAVNNWIYKQRRYFVVQESLDTYTTQDDNGVNVYEYDRGYIDKRLHEITKTDTLNALKSCLLSSLDNRVNKDKVATVFDLYYIKNLTIATIANKLNYSEQTVNKTIRMIKDVLFNINNRLNIYETLTELIYSEETA